MGSMRLQINKFMSSGSGHKDAIAKALSMKRKAKKMADGGEVQDANGETEVNEEAMKMSDFKKNAADMMHEDSSWGAGHPSMQDAAKMAEGGVVEGDEGDSEEAGDAVYPKGTEEQGLSQSVLAEQMLAKGLQMKKMKANDNTNSYNPFPGKEVGQKMNESGLLVNEHPESALGNKPDLDWIDDGTGEPMSSMPNRPASLGHEQINGVPGGPALSDEARSAIEAKKRKRRFMV